MASRTGERLDDASALYGADLARHLAAYRFASEAIAEEGADGGLVVDLGCGTGYGSVALAASGLGVVGIDRVRPAARGRDARARFVVGDLTRLPFADGSVARIVSFQVVEHFADASAYLGELARCLAPDGLALITTPNRLESDGENPHHLREYAAGELEAVLGRHFERVELRGVHAVGPAADYHASRLRQIRRVTRLDPLGLRRRLPRAFVEWGFARLSLVVRLLIRSGGDAASVGEADYPIGEAAPDCLDLLALCRGPRTGSLRPR